MKRIQTNSYEWNNWLFTKQITRQPDRIRWYETRKINIKKIGVNIRNGDSWSIWIYIFDFERFVSPEILFKIVLDLPKFTFSLMWYWPIDKNVMIFLPHVEMWFFFVEIDEKKSHRIHTYLLIDDVYAVYTHTYIPHTQRTQKNIHVLHTQHCLDQYYPLQNCIDPGMW